MPLRDELTAAIGTRRGTDAADVLCDACVDLLAVDAAAISVVLNGANAGTLGASSADARTYDELQFTFGEGPCLDSVSTRTPVFADDLRDTAEVRWPAYTPAMVSHEIRSVVALPVVLAGEYIGALDLFRADAGRLDVAQLAAALVAAEVAGLPMLDLLSDDLQVGVSEPGTRAWSELGALTRHEVSQATGMLVAQLDLDPAAALVRLRAHAFATGRTATDVARAILDGRLRLTRDE